MKSFVTCYIIEISGESLIDDAKLEYLQSSSDEYMKNMLSYVQELRTPQTETVTVRVGKIACNEEKNITEHLCLKKIKLKKLDK